MKKKKNQKMSYAESLLHIPNPMHLAACQEGSRVFRDRSKYTRKGKSKYDYRKDL